MKRKPKSPEAILADVQARSEMRGFLAGAVCLFFAGIAMLAHLPDPEPRQKLEEPKGFTEYAEEIVEVLR